MLISSILPLPFTIVVVVLLTITLLQDPNIFIVTSDSSNPESYEILVPPVRTAISSRISFLYSPKEGALIAHTFSVPLNLLAFNASKTESSKSSAIRRIDLPSPAIWVRTNFKSFILFILCSVIRI